MTDAEGRFHTVAQQAAMRLCRKRGEAHQRKAAARVQAG